jgi:hypothetical protein
MHADIEHAGEAASPGDMVAKVSGIPHTAEVY